MQKYVVMEDTKGQFAMELAEKIKVGVTVENFVAKPNQTVFNLSKAYEQDKNKIQIFVGGVPQYSPINFEETSNKSFTITGVKEGQKITAVYHDSVNLTSRIKNPNVGRVEETLYLSGGTTMLLSDIDINGVIYSVRWDNVILKSTDGTNFSVVLDVKPFLDTTNNETIVGCALQISDTGRIITCTNKGRVLVSDEAKKTLVEKFTFKGGYTINTWGYEKKGRFILMCGYLVNKNATNPGREVYFSQDHGNTWKCIFEEQIANMVNASDYHIHQAIFDEYSNMIMVVVGDTANNQIFYSYDFGESWNKVNPTGKTTIHPTSSLTFPEGIAFGSDDMPEGIWWWDRPLNNVNPVIRDTDFKPVKTFNVGYPTLGNIGVKGSKLVTLKGSFGVIGFVNHGTTVPGHPRLFATGDGGRSWHEIWKSTNGSHDGFKNILLREEGADIFIYATYNLEGSARIFKAKMPEFTAI